ncbi:membrane protein [Microbacterium phage Pumpernickel]|uniref:Membrane protein n=1 Tax=Microbacterium phage Pumpernickel TaxID=2885983 RepID=A0AAE8Y7G7_9CAUD|nr:membrane protein [Microbacterium phage Pumpernickel]UDL15863.1 membrane protein [Microbacterium phage Pumpernickel]
MSVFWAVVLSSYGIATLMALCISIIGYMDNRDPEMKRVFARGIFLCFAWPVFLGIGVWRMLLLMGDGIKDVWHDADFRGRK